MKNSYSLSFFRVLLSIICFCIYGCNSENGEAGNFANPSKKHQKQEVDSIGKLAYQIYSQDSDSAIALSRKALRLSQEYNLPKRSARWLTKVGAFYRIGGLYHVADDYYQQALASLSTIRDTLWLALTREEMGFNFQQQGEYEKSLENTRYALDFWGKLDSTEKLIDVELDLVEYFLDQGKLEMANEEFETIDRLLEDFSGKHRKVRASLMKGTLLIKENHFEQAIATLKSVDSPEAFTNLGFSYQELGDLLEKKSPGSGNKNYLNSIEYHQQSLSYHADKKKLDRLILDYWNLGAINRRLKNFQTAIDTLRKGIQLARENREGIILAGMFKTLSDTYENLNMGERALEHYKKSIAIRDSIQRNKDEAVIRFAEVHFDTQKKEQAKILAEQESERRTKQLLISILAFLLAGALGIFYFYRARSRKIRMEQQAEINSQIVVDLIQEQTIENLNSRIEGQEDERTRIARELHDQLGGTLAAVKFSLEGMENKMPTELIDSYRNTHKLLQSATDNTRTLSHQMKALHLEDLGLDDSLQQFCDALNNNGSLQVHFNSTSISESHVSPKAELQLYRVAQELLQNVIKHAQASEVFLQLTYEEDKLTLMLEDDGKGFNPEKVKSGMGMQNIENRVAQIDGKLDFDSLIGQGTTVIIEVPTERD
ncbi:MAG: histidine kinase [Bacteroidia bacterium]|nr:histidine kinase [Bacteroidia bacterium]